MHSRAAAPDPGKFEPRGYAEPYTRQYLGRTLISGAEMARGRPRRLGGHELVEQLNAAVAALIKENRKLKRQNETLAARSSKGSSVNVDRRLRGMRIRVQKALDAPSRRRRKASAATATAQRATRKKAV